MGAASTAAHRAIRATWAVEAPRLVGGLVRLVGDLDLAEDLAQEALLAALERWPGSGIPDRPGAWLMTVAKNRGVEALRRRAQRDRKHAALAAELSGTESPDPGEALDRVVDDDVLRLMLVACHPVLAAEGRVALTLRLLGGLTTDEIARAFLVPEPTVAQRIVRAKRRLAEARISFEVPRGAELSARLTSVLEVLYLIFNEGYAATRGDEWMRPELCQDALRLGRVVVALAPREPEAHGLLALMELHASRARARVDASGAPVLLGDQDRARWDHLAIERGLAALTRAEALASRPGPYTLQAAIAACHARARSGPDTDWRRIVALYGALLEATRSPVVALNHAVAVAMAEGPAVGLAHVEALAHEPVLARYALLPAVRGDLLARLGRRDEARLEFERAASLVENRREKSLLLERARGCRRAPEGEG